MGNGPAPHEPRLDSPDDIPTLTLFLPENTGARDPRHCYLSLAGGYEMLAFDHEGTQREENIFRSEALRPSSSNIACRPRLSPSRAAAGCPARHPGRAKSRRRLENEPGQNRHHGVFRRAAISPRRSSLISTPADPQAADPSTSSAPGPISPFSLMPSSAEGGHHPPGHQENLLGPDPDPALVESLSNETQVTPQTPPTLLVHSEDDEGVPI